MILKNIANGLSSDALKGSSSTSISIGECSKFALGFANWERVVNVGSGYPLSICNLGNGIALVATSGSSGGCRICRTTDYGKTWVFTGQDFATADLRVSGTIGSGICFACDRAEPYHFFRSANYGLSWTDLGNIDSTTTYGNIKSLGAGHVVMKTSSGMVHSDDYGVTWEHKDLPSGDTRSTLFNIGSSLYTCGRLNGSTGYHVSVSDDYGTTWTTVSSVDTGHTLLDTIFFDDVKVLCIYYSDGRFCLSHDMGITTTYYSPAFSGIIINYLGDGIVLYGGLNSAKLYISYNFGVNWVEAADFSSYLETRVYSIEYMGNGVLLVTGYPKGGVYRCTMMQDPASNINRTREHISVVSDILGSPKLLCPPFFAPSNVISGNSIMQYTVFDYTRNANNLTVDSGYIHNRMGELYSGGLMYITYNGTSQYLYRANDTDFDFGNSLTDTAFSLVVAVNPDDVTSRQIIGKWDANSLREWRLFFDASGYPTLQLYDESVDKYIGRQDQTAFTTGSWKILVATYDGSGVCAGCKIYIDGVQLDDADYTDAGYVAMEAVSANLTVGALKNAAVYGEYYDGKMTWIGVAAKELSPDEVWSLTQRLKGVLGI